MNEKLLKEIGKKMPKTRYYLNDQFNPDGFEDVHSQLVESCKNHEKLFNVLSEAFIREAEQEVYGIEEAILDEHFHKLHCVLNDLNDCADERLNDHFPTMKQLQGWREAKTLIEREINRVENFPETVAFVRKELQRLAGQSSFQSVELKDRLKGLLEQLETAPSPW